MRIFAMIACLVVTVTLIGCKPETPSTGKPIQTVQKPISEQYINVKGLKIRYKIEGYEGKSTLVLLHGFTSSLDTWDSLTDALSDSYRIVRFDLPGHGLTGPDPEHRYGHVDFVDFVNGLLNALDIQKPILVGNSMGGNTAWRYAARFPDDIAGLVLIDASGFPLNGLSDKPIPLSPALESYFLKPTKFAVNFGLKNQYADVKKIPDGRADKILEMMQVSGNGKAFVEIFKTFTLPDPTENLAQITVPTLIIWGEKDSVVPLAHADLFHRAIAQSKVYVIENSGHVSHEENPDQTANAIRLFLDK